MKEHYCTLLRHRLGQKHANFLDLEMLYVPGSLDSRPGTYTPRYQKRKERSSFTCACQLQAGIEYGYLVKEGA